MLDLRRFYLRFRYSTSLLPSQLLSRGIRRGKRLGSICVATALALYGRDQDVRRLMTTVKDLYSTGMVPEGQMLQDAFVISRLGRESSTFFDVGASMPRKYSNTYMLQFSFGYRGVLVEPHPELADLLRRERVTSSVYLAECAAGSSDREDLLIEFGPLSTLATGVEPDMFTRLRQQRMVEGRAVKVKVKSTEQILAESGLIGGIDFLSIDVEGADFEVLKAFPMQLMRPKVITIEHNLSRVVEDQIDGYLAPIGYRRVCRRWSSIDSWYVLDI